MKTLRFPLVLLLLGASLFAQDAATPTSPTATMPAGKRTPQELEQLLAPIALYPDALIALILPASTAPTDIVLAARHLSENPGDRSQIEHRAWDDSVKSLTNYPEVLQWMDENLHWTQQVGEAFAEQSADVMQAIQRLRAKARAAGTLVDTPQQQVLAEPQVIRIVPAQPDIIYVPHYEPEIVFVDRPVYYHRPFLTFGAGVAVGSWLAFDCDWRRNSIWIGNRHRRWTGHDWRRPVVSISTTVHVTRTPEVRHWRPPPPHSRPSFAVGNRFRSEIARPTPIGVTSARSYTNRSSGSWDRRPDASAPQVVNPLPRTFTNRSRDEQTGPRAASSVVTPPTPAARADVSTATPNVPPLARTFTNRSRNDNPGPRAPSAVVTPPAPAARVDVPSAAPNLQPLPQARRSGGDGSRDNDSRVRSFRGGQSNAATPPPVVPALPMATPRQNAQPINSMPQRSYSRAQSAAPTVVPALPMTSRASAPATVAPAPAAPAPTPAAQPAAPAASRGESRGHRGSGGGRRDDNQAH